MAARASNGPHARREALLAAPEGAHSVARGGPSRLTLSAIKRPGFGPFAFVPAEIPENGTFPVTARFLLLSNAGQTGVPRGNSIGIIASQK